MPFEPIESERQARPSEISGLDALMHVGMGSATQGGVLATQRLLSEVTSEPFVHLTTTQPFADLSHELSHRPRQFAPNANLDPVRVTEEELSSQLDLTRARRFAPGPLSSGEVAELTRNLPDSSRAWNTFRQDMVGHSTETAQTAIAGKAATNITTRELQLAMQSSPELRSLVTAEESIGSAAIHHSLGRGLLEGALVATAGLGADYAGMRIAGAFGYDQNSYAQKLFRPNPFETTLSVLGFAMGRSLATKVAYSAAGWALGKSINFAAKSPFET